MITLIITQKSLINNSPRKPYFLSILARKHWIRFECFVWYLNYFSIWYTCPPVHPSNLLSPRIFLLILRIISLMWVNQPTILSIKLYILSHCFIVSQLPRDPRQQSHARHREQCHHRKHAALTANLIDGHMVWHLEGYERHECSQPQQPDYKQHKGQHVESQIIEDVQCLAFRHIG